MGSVIPFPLRAVRETSGDVGAHSICRAPDCLWNSAEPPGDIFDKMVARIRVARCYMLCHTQLSAAVGRQHANVSPINRTSYLNTRPRAMPRWHRAGLITLLARG